MMTIIYETAPFIKCKLIRNCTLRVQFLNEEKKLGEYKLFFKTFLSKNNWVKVFVHNFIACCYTGPVEA